MTSDLAPGSPTDCALSKHIRSHLIAMKLAPALMDVPSNAPRGETLLQRNDRKLRAMGITDRRRCTHLLHSNPFWQGVTCPECGKAV